MAAAAGSLLAAAAASFALGDLRLGAKWREYGARFLYLDAKFGWLDPETRRAAIEKVRDEAGGSCRNEGPFVAENALRGSWRMRCGDGDLHVSITLAPTRPAGVQFLEVKRLARDERLAPDPACR